VTVPEAAEGETVAVSVKLVPLTTELADDVRAVVLTVVPVLPLVAAGIVPPEPHPSMPAINAVRATLKIRVQADAFVFLSRASIEIPCLAVERAHPGKAFSGIRD